VTPAADEPDAPIVQILLGEIESALRRNGFPEDQIGPALTDIRKELIETAEAPPDKTKGEPKIIKGRLFYGLKDMGGQVIESGVKLAIAAILAGHGDPTHAKEAVVDCLIGMRKTILKLSDAQKVVCVAIMNISNRKRSKIFIEPGASAAEIIAYFKDCKKTLPPGLDKILDELSHGEPRVLEAASYGDRGPFYQVRL